MGGYKYNTDLPREGQIRIIMKNFDKMKADGEKLQKENENLKKQLEQKDILYKNMIETYGGKKAANLSNELDKAQIAKDKIALKYKNVLQDNEMLKSKNKELNCQVLELKNQVKELNTFPKRFNALMGLFKDVNFRISNLIDAYNNPEIEKDDMSFDEHKNKSVAVTYQEYSLQQFQKYVRDVMKNYKETGSLRGIATLAKNYGVRSMTKEQFFQFGLHSMANVTDEYLASIFPQTKKR